MPILLVLLAVYVAAALAYWLWQAYALWRTLRGLPRLGDLDPPAPVAWPPLSVVVPARDEADTIEAAARSLLAEDYPNLEIVFVDDRSADATGAVIDRLASEDGRVRAIHVAELPAGWLGKVNALRQGLDASDGQWALFTDADVHVARGTLRTAVAHALDGGLDHLAAFPSVHQASLVVDAAVSAFVRQLVASMRPWAVRDARSRAFMGIGAFNLVRRAALDETEGFEWLRMEVGDDVGLGLVMKRAGKRSEVASAFGLVGLQWQTSLGRMARNAEKGYGPVCRFSIVRSLVLAAVTLALELAPFVAPLALLWPELRPVGYAGLAATAAYLATVVLLRRWAGTGVLSMLLGPLTAPLASALMVRTAILGKRRRGAVWRGTLYSEADLRAGQRVRFP